jgi:hypothetical protein
MKLPALVTSSILMFALGIPTAAVHDGNHAAGPGDKIFKVGKNGDVKIGNDVKIGEILVKKGKYLFEHRVDGGQHIVVLTSIDNKNSSEAVVHEIRTRLITSRDPVKKSALFAEEQRDRSYRVTVIQIAGENGDHTV